MTHAIENCMSIVVGFYAMVHRTALPDLEGQSPRPVHAAVMSLYRRGQGRGMQQGR